MIKPYFNSILHIKNLSTYRDFLRRRPTKAQQFKLSMIRGQSRLSTVTENAVQRKLLKALRIAKPVSKVDLQECQLIDYDFWEPKLIAACKKMSKVKTFCLMIPKSDSEMKCFRYFPKLKSLLFTLEAYSLSLDQDILNRTDKFFKIPYYLKALKYCPKVHSLDFADADDYYYTKIVIKSGPYLRSLRSLVLRGKGWKEDQFEFPLESCQNVRSISLQFPNLDSWESLPRILSIFSKISNLQEIDFSSMRYWILGFLPAFRKITEKGTLKKVKFELGYQEMSRIEKILKALKPCHLTHFSLKAQIRGEQLKTISRFIQSMDHLESLHLHIQNQNFSLNNDDFIELCKQISKLQALRSLMLSFPMWMKVFKDATVLNFIPYLSDAFNKPVKIENFRLECNQLNPSEALQSLISILENSADFLTHFKIDIGILPCTLNTYQSILKLIQSLSSIQVLKIPCLVVSGSTNHFLNDLTQVVQRLKYLRVFEIGEINDTVAPLDLLNVVEAISSKRGLRQFHCQLDYESQIDLWSAKNYWDLNLNRILEKNPYLETFILTSISQRFNLGMYKWTEN